MANAQTVSTQTLQRDILANGLQYGQELLSALERTQAVCYGDTAFAIAQLVKAAGEAVRVLQLYTTCPACSGKVDTLPNGLHSCTQCDGVSGVCTSKVAREVVNLGKWATREDMGNARFVQVTLIDANMHTWHGWVDADTHEILQSG